MPSWEANRPPVKLNSPHFMKPEGSLPHSQEQTTRPYPQLNRSSPYTPSPILLLDYPSADITYLNPSSQGGSFTLRIPKGAILNYLK